MNTLSIGIIIMTGWLLAACVSSTPLSPKQPQALAIIKASLAQGYMAQGQKDEALVQINQAVSLAPRDASLWLIRAELYRQLTRHTEAEISYKEALSLAPEAGAPNHHYGWYLCQIQARPDEAKPYFKRALADATYMYQTQVQMQQQTCYKQV